MDRHTSIKREQEPSGALPRRPRALVLPDSVGLDECADPAGEQDRRDHRRHDHGLSPRGCVDRERDTRDRDDRARIPGRLVERAGPVKALLNVVGHGKPPVHYYGPFTYQDRQPGWSRHAMIAFASGACPRTLGAYADREACSSE